jgi:hypothetical protein
VRLSRSTLCRIIARRLGAGWVPWVRVHPRGMGSQEVWARMHQGRLEVARPITPPEGEQVSAIFYQGGVDEAHASRPA